MKPLELQQQKAKEAGNGKFVPLTEKEKKELMDKALAATVEQLEAQEEKNEELRQLKSVERPAVIRAIAEAFPSVDLMDSWTWFRSGQNTDGAHNPVTNRRIGRGDILSLACCPMLYGYLAAVGRTLFCGEPAPAALALWDSVGEEVRDGVDVVELGLRAAHACRCAGDPGAELAVLAARGVGCLALDEPTNHLDLPAVEELERALAAFEGTLLLVTHDRRFLEGVGVTRVIDLSPRAPARGRPRARRRPPGRR